MTRYFTSRTDAAEKLAAALARYRGQNALVLAVPRGAVGMGRIITDALEGELDVVLVRKLRSPFNPEYAIGSVDESGWVYRSPDAQAAGADEAYLEREKQAQLTTLRRRRARWSGSAPTQTRSFACTRRRISGRWASSTGISSRWKTKRWLRCSPRAADAGLLTD